MTAGRQPGARVPACRLRRIAPLGPQGPQALAQLPTWAYVRHTVVLPLPSSV